jgi:hypothetical protein
MEFSSPHQHFTSEIVRRRCFKDAPLTLLDIGCSGGIAPLWRIYEPDLQAVGVDPVVDECARLSAKEKNSGIRYVPAFVGLPEDHPFNRERKGRPPTERNPWARLSAAAATDILSQRVRQEAKLPVLNTWQSERLAVVKKLGLEELAATQHFTQVDFIKIDIDGNDLEALFSGERLIRESPVLGLVLEVNFYGGDGIAEHTFHNTDRLMRSWGFDLFGLTTRKYASGAMPNRFEYDMPAQAVSGRPYQGDALYLRDAIALEDAGQPALAPLKLLKLACLFENFCLPDFAAELILRHGTAMGIDPDQALDLLARGFRNDEVGYREHMRRFRENPASFYRSGTL